MDNNNEGSDAAILKSISKRERALKRQAAREAQAQSLVQQASGKPKSILGVESNTHALIEPRRAKVTAMSRGK